MINTARLASIFAMVAAFCATTAFANPIALKIQSGATTIIVSDNDVVITPATTGLDQNPIPGEVSWGGAVNGWTVNVDFGLGSLALATIEEMDLTYNVQGGAGATDPITLSFTEINVPDAIPTFMAGDDGGNNKTNTQYSASYDAGNGFFTTGTLISSSLPQGPSGVFSVNGTGSGSFTTPFSVTQRIVITASGPFGPGNRLATGDASLSGMPVAVSEPSTLLMLAGVLAGLVSTLAMTALRSI